jgi:YD repeat-containing protein
MTHDAANQLLTKYHPLAGVKAWAFDLAGNRSSQD